MFSSRWHIKWPFKPAQTAVQDLFWAIYQGNYGGRLFVVLTSYFDESGPLRLPCCADLVVLWRPPIHGSVSTPTGERI